MNTRQLVSDLRGRPALLRCGPCGYVASPHSPEGEAVLARYAAALRVASASGRRWPSARGMPDDA